MQLKSRASLRDVPLLDEAYEALVVQLAREQAKGLGAASDFVFTSETGRPLGRERIAKRGVTRAAKNGGARARDAAGAAPLGRNPDSARPRADGDRRRR